jgi:CCR4-NOT transcription complex subunit 7/8
MSANPNSYLNQNAQMNPFANSNLMAFTSGLNTPGGGGLGGGVGSQGDTGLASHAARMGFAHAGNLQQQQQQQHPGQQQQGHVMGGELHPTRNQVKGRIREVWKHNLHEEMATLRDLVDNYPFIAMVGLGSARSCDGFRDENC